MPIDQTEIYDLIKNNFPFRKLGDEYINLVVDNLSTEYLDAGQRIYQDGSAADHLYIILSGLVKITTIEDGQEQPVATLRTGDLFGVEILKDDLARLTNATALKDAVLLSISRDRLEFLIERIPYLKESLATLLDSLKLYLKMDFEWLESDEAVYFLSRRHPINLFVRLLPAFILAFLTIPLVFLFFGSGGTLTLPLILIGLDLLLVAAWTIWMYIDWRNDYSIITNRRVVFQERIVMLYDSRIESPLNQIMSVTIETDQIGRWLSYGDVVVRTYTGKIILPLLANPRQVASLLEWEWHRASMRQAFTAKSEMEELIKKRLGYIERDEPPPEPNEQIGTVDRPGSARDLLQHLFNLRYEKAGMIVYRKHWFILLRRIFLPTTFLLLVLIIFITSMLNIFTLLSIPAMLSLVVLSNLVLGLWWLYEYVDWGNDLYIISKDQIIDVNRKPLGREERRAAPIKNILSIDFERLGIIGLLLNFGTVYIRVGDSELTFDYVFNPSDVQRELFNKLAEATYRETQASMDFERQRMADWIETYHHVVEESGKEDNSVAKSEDMR